MDYFYSGLIEGFCFLPIWSLTAPLPHSLSLYWKGWWSPFMFHCSKSVNHTGLQSISIVWVICSFNCSQPLCCDNVSEGASHFLLRHAFLNLFFQSLKYKLFVYPHLNSLPQQWFPVTLQGGIWKDLATEWFPSDISGLSTKRAWLKSHS